MAWLYDHRRQGWFIAIDRSGLSSELLYGPFNESEAILAGQVHGVPFDQGVR